jgi:hypothetical protein
MIDYLLFYVLLENLSLMKTSSLPVKGLQNLGLCSPLRDLEQGGIFIVSHLL